MNLFRSEEHLKRWLLYFQAGGDYVMSVGDWATVFSTSLFRRRLEPDYLARSPGYLEDYRQALRGMGKALPAPDRVLSTIMFTDIVDSTVQAALVGDAQWRLRLGRHNEVVRSQLEHFGGREIKQTGDGLTVRFRQPGQGDSKCDVDLSGNAKPRPTSAAGIHLGECEVLGDDLGLSGLPTLRCPGEELANQLPEPVAGNAVTGISRARSLLALKTAPREEGFVDEDALVEEEVVVVFDFEASDPNGEQPRAERVGVEVF